ncbi:MAG: zinc ABC transporter substrate-binding protein [Thiolinea sp.]
MGSGLARLLCRLLVVSGCLLAAGTLSAADAPVIFVSVPPQQYFVERIGGDQVDVSAMVQPGFSPHTYEPTPRQISALSRAAAYIRVGMPFEEAWMPRIVAVNPAMRVLDAREGIELLPLAEHEHEHSAGHPQHEEDEHGHDEHEEATTHPQHEEDGHDYSAENAYAEMAMDPHIWTSPRLVKQMAAQINELLQQLLPEQAEVFADNYRQFVGELDALDAELTDLFAGQSVRRFMVFHPSWGYLAAAYGLEQVPIESEGKEPGARALTALIRQARAEGIRTIFVQPQFDRRMAEQIARAIDGQVASLDPLDPDYLHNLRRAARLIAGVADE